MNDDKKTWLDAMQNVVPLKPDNKTKVKPPKKLAQKIHQEAQAHVASLIFYDNDIIQPEYIFFARSGLQYRVQQQLRTGKIKIEATLDLHGFTVDESRQKVSDFLIKTHAKGLRCVKIIHGKGQNTGSILRNKVYQWLPQCDFVLAFCSAIANDGGSGAVYILFKHL